MKTRMCHDKAVSLLGFGTMRMPETEPGKIDRAKAFAMLDEAYAAGVTYYDTAYPYHQGDSERMLGEWLKTKPRESVLVATKFPIWKEDTQEGFRRLFHEQLEKLGLEYVDFYLMHAVNAERFEKLKAMDVFPLLDELKQSGKVRQIGFSFHDEYPVFEQVLDSYPWDFCQLQLNYMDTEIQAGMRGYELARSRGVPVFVMEPIKGGSLAQPPQDVRAVFDRLHPDWSGASWALRWVASLDNVAVILSGMSTLEQVRDNVRTFSQAEPLTEEEQRAVRRAAEVYRSRIQVPCTGCAYCMPCPAGVDIPANFRVYNGYSVYGDDAASRRSYDAIGEGARASACVACGRCMEQCPQHIEIPEMLRRVNAWAQG